MNTQGQDGVWNANLQTPDSGGGFQFKRQPSEENVTIKREPSASVPPPAETQISEGYVEVNEGHIYWKYSIAADETTESRPVLLFIHAGVADHTMWNAQVEYLLERGWNCLQFDMLGFGLSQPSDMYLFANPRPKFDPIEQLDRLLAEVLPPDATVIPIGLSIGASLALGYTVHRRELVSGLATIAGGVRGFDYNNTPAEDELFNKLDSLTEYGDFQGAANLTVRAWGDGPLQEAGRLAEDVAERMLNWNIDISQKECAKRGGTALDTIARDPPAATQLHTLDIPVAVGYGTFDETYTTAAMQFLAMNVNGANAREFRTAHMVNLEVPDEFNQWLGEWLEENFLQDDPPSPPWRTSTASP
jgi:pimeloyl-ACP methyl ester carboxylesterase